MDISNVMTLLINNSGLSECELSRRINITVATLNKIKTGVMSNPTAKTLERIAQYFGITIDQLMGKSPLETYFSKNLCCIPLVSINNLSNIQDIPMDFSHHKEWKRVEVNNDVKNHRIFATTTIGDAMYPLLDEQTIIIVDQDYLVTNKALVLVHLHNSNEIVIRKLLIDGSFKILKSLNSSFPDITFDSKDKIIGVIISKIKDHR
jgi:transcriptional regulator with XRE-family HTH domain